MNITLYNNNQCSQIADDVPDVDVDRDTREDMRSILIDEDDMLSGGTDSGTEGVTKWSFVSTVGPTWTEMSEYYLLRL